MAQLAELTRSASRSGSRAQTIGKRLGRTVIGPEVHLLALLRDDKSKATKILEEHGLTYARVYSWLDDHPEFEDDYRFEGISGEGGLLLLGEEPMEQMWDHRLRTGHVALGLLNCSGAIQDIFTHYLTCSHAELRAALESMIEESRRQGN